jgi:hypothetical protein
VIATFELARAFIRDTKGKSGSGEIVEAALLLFW